MLIKKVSKCLTEQNDFCFFAVTKVINLLILNY